MAEELPRWLEGVTFSRIERYDFRIESWEYIDGGEEGHTPRDFVDLIADAIVDEYRVRKDRTIYDDRYMRASQWLLVTCYHAILVCLYNDWFEELEARIARFGRNVRGPKVERPLFMKGIMAIFAHDKPVKLATGKMRKPLTDEKDRQRLAKSMWFGFRHYVEPRELIAFNRVCTLHRNVKNLSDDRIDQRYHEQIIQRRFALENSAPDLEVFRGGYSEELGLAVKEIRVSRWKRIRSMVSVDDPNF